MQIKDCSTCGNAKWNIESKYWVCQLNDEQTFKCIDTAYNEYWIPQETVQGIITAEELGLMAAQIIYRKSKAKFFNVLESQVDKDKLEPCKKITEDIIDRVVKDVYNLITKTLGDWQMEVEAGGELTEESEKQAREEYKEIKNKVR